MNKLRPLLGAALLASAALTSAADRPSIDVTEFELENGMKWLLFPQHESPTIAAGWVAHVGSANERPGITGISHLFEHMLFKGTHTIGTTDIGRDLELIEEQERVRSEMRAEMKKMREALRRGEASFWETYREKVGAVTRADVQRVAQKHLQADQVRILVVGNQSEIDAGDGEHDVSLGELSVGKDTTIPLPDPLTLERPSS